MFFEEPDYKEEYQNGEKVCFSSNPGITFKIDEVRLPRYPAGQMGNWFRPIIAGMMKENKLEPMMRFVLMKEIMDGTDCPHDFSKFEKMCMIVLGCADLHDRLWRMKKLYADVMEYTDSLANGFLGKMLKSKISEEDYQRNLESALYHSKRFADEIKMVEALITEEQK